MGYRKISYYLNDKGIKPVEVISGRIRMCSLFLKDTNKEKKDWNVLIENTNQCGERWKLGGKRINGVI